MKLFLQYLGIFFLGLIISSGVLHAQEVNIPDDNIPSLKFLAARKIVNNINELVKQDLNLDRQSFHCLCQYAAQYKNVFQPIIRRLIETSHDDILRNQDNYINNVIEHDHKQGINFLCAAGFNSDLCKNIQVFIARAVKENKLNIVQLWFHHQVGMNQHLLCDSLLHIAVDANLSDMVTLLLDCGANINEVNCFGRTPLHTAVAYNLLDITQLLLMRGACTAQKDQNGFHALDIAMRNGSDENIMNLLRNHY